MTYNTTGIILRYRDVGEFDRIYTVLSAEHGKIDAWAQGVRKPKSKLVAHLQPLYFCDFMFARGRRFDRIAQVRVLNRWPEIWGDLDAMSRAIYACSLVDQVLRPGTKERAVFGLLMDVLTTIHNSPSSAPWPPSPMGIEDGPSERRPRRGEGEGILTSFSLKLLCETGFSPELHDCVICKKPVEGLSRLFDAVRGGVVCATCIAPPLTPPRQGGETNQFPPLTEGVADGSSERRPRGLGGVGVFPISSLTLETLETVLASSLARLEMPDAISRELAQIASAMMAAHFGEPPKAWSFIEGLAREPLYAGVIA